jgi:hypothetical protein
MFSMSAFLPLVNDVLLTKNVLTSSIVLYRGYQADILISQQRI